jgi:hypothetical protein
MAATVTTTPPAKQSLNINVVFGVFGSATISTVHQQQQKQQQPQ